jgi:hypothetical protein
MYLTFTYVGVNGPPVKEIALKNVLLTIRQSGQEPAFERNRACRTKRQIRVAA